MSIIGAEAEPSFPGQGAAKNEVCSISARRSKQRAPSRHSDCPPGIFLATKAFCEGIDLILMAICHCLFLGITLASSQRVTAFIHRSPHSANATSEISARNKATDALPKTSSHVSANQISGLVSSPVHPLTIIGPARSMAAVNVMCPLGLKSVTAIIHDARGLVGAPGCQVFGPPHSSRAKPNICPAHCSQ